MLMKYCHVLLIFIAILFTNSEEFTRTPPRVVYKYVDEAVYLDWEFEQTPYRRSWSYPDTDSKIRIASVTRNNTFIGDDYKGRISYSPDNGRITIQNLKISDEGNVQLEVILSNGTILRDKVSLKILRVPVFVPLLHEEFVASQKQNISVTCNVESRPGVNITWFMGEKSLQTDNTKYIVNSIQTEANDIITTKSIFQLLNASVDDISSYICNASNEFDTATSSTTIYVRYPPTIRNFGPDIGTVENAENFPLTCNIFGVPLPKEINWYKGNSTEKLVSGPEFQINNETKMALNDDEKYISSVLSIRKVTAVHFANYTCEAISESNDQGKLMARKTARLIVSHKPYFLEPPDENYYVSLSTNATLNCTVQAYFRPTVKWETNVTTDSRFIFHPERVIINKNGRGIVESLLTITNLTRQDHGIYTCRANDSKDTVMRHITLVLKYLPIAESKPNSAMKIEEYSTEKLEVKLVSYPEPTITWMLSKNNGGSYTDITGRAREKLLTSRKFEDVRLTTLGFPSNISRTDEGIYLVNATNDLGSAIFYFNVTVEWGPVFDTSSINGAINVTNGSLAIFQCTVSGKPLPLITWEKNGKDATTSEENIGGNTGDLQRSKQSILRISSVTPEDSATYTCIAENIVAGKRKRISQSQVMKVLYKPVLDTSNTNQEVTISHTLSLSCHARGYPPISVYNWTKDGVTLNNNQSQLKIFRVEKSSEGIYKCNAINSEGSSATVIHNITVLVEPSFTDFPRCKIDDINYTYTCYCNGVGYPSPNVYWTRPPNKTIVSNGKFYNGSITTDIYGTYRCHLSNTHGNLTADFLISNIDNPDLTVTPWSSWSSCNISCGNGHKNRSRTCRIANCKETKSDFNTCTVACPVADRQTWHKDEFIIIWVLIPIIAILLIIGCVWFCRTRRNSDEAIFVPINRSLSQPPSVRSVQTNRDIYLPDQNKLAVVNNGFVLSGPDTIPIVVGPKETDTVEVEMEFGEESLKREMDPPYTKMDDSKKRRKKSENHNDLFFKLYDKTGNNNLRGGSPPPIPAPPIPETDYDHYEDDVDDDNAYTNKAYQYHDN